MPTADRFAVSIIADPCHAEDSRGRDGHSERAGGGSTKGILSICWPFGLRGGPGWVGRIDEPVVLRLGVFGQVRDVVERVVTADREHGQEKPSPASGRRFGAPRAR